MEQIYYACADCFDWIEDKFGTLAAWAAAVLVIAIFLGGIGIVIWWFSR